MYNIIQYLVLVKEYLHSILLAPSVNFYANSITKTQDLFLIQKLNETESASNDRVFPAKMWCFQQRLGIPTKNDVPRNDRDFSCQNVMLGPNSLKISLLKIAFNVQNCKELRFSYHHPHGGRGQVFISQNIILMESIWNVQICTQNFIFATHTPNRIGMGIILLKVFARNCMTCLALHRESMFVNPNSTWVMLRSID